MVRTSDSDTIVAIATAPGEGAIGIVRMSGPFAVRIADACFKGKIKLADAEPRTLLYGRFEHAGQSLDEVLASVMYGPNSYTGQDTVEFNCHGGPWILRKVVQALVEKGARLALPGEFTKRAYLNGKMDLTQAQAVADMISAPSDLGLQSAFFQLRGGLKSRFEKMATSLRETAMLLEVGLDFSEDVEIDLEQVKDTLEAAFDQVCDMVASYDQGKLIRGGALVALVGQPNVGKSSLLNRLLEEDRAIVTDIPGTTRDTIEESIDIQGIRVTLVDTAGLRDTDDPVEREGTKRSRQFMDRAQVVLMVVDGSKDPSEEERRILETLDSQKSILVLNKSDLGLQKEWKGCWQYGGVSVCALSGIGIEELRHALALNLMDKANLSIDSITHEYQVVALREAQIALKHALEGLQMGNPGEIISVDVRIALDAVAGIIGETTADDVLDQIFRNFCIGK